MFVIISHDLRGMFEKKGLNVAAHLNDSNVVLLYGSYYILWIYDL